MDKSANIHSNYPYPVLGNYNDFKLLNYFIINMRRKSSNNKHLYNVTFDYSNIHSTYEELILKKKIKYVVVVSCQQTFHKSYHENFQKTINFSINQNEIRGIVYFTGYLISNDKLNSFSPENMNDFFYGNSKFDIHPGEVLAVSNTVKEFIDPEFTKQDKSKFKHIIQFVPDETLNGKGFYKVQKWGNDQLNVSLAENLYKEWRLVNKERYLFINHCAFYLSVLMEAIEKIDNVENNEELKEYKWFFVIEQQLTLNGIDPDEDTHVKAQLLMKEPIRNFVKQLSKIDEEFGETNESL